MSYTIVKEIKTRPNQYCDLDVEINVVKPDKRIIDDVGFDEGKIIGIEIDPMADYISCEDLYDLGVKLIRISRSIQKEFDGYGNRLKKEVGDVG